MVKPAGIVLKNILKEGRYLMGNVWTEMKEAKEAYDAVIVDLKADAHTKNIAAYAEDQVELAIALDKNEKVI